MKNISLIIPAAGIGKRFSSNIKKQFIEISEKPILFWTIRRLLKAYNFNEIIIGANKEDSDIIENIISDLNIEVPYILATGGKERANTVINCIAKSNCDYVAIHDSVRPFVRDNVIKETINIAFEKGAAICALPIHDTIKKVEDNKIISTIPRNNLFLAHTPQVFKKDVIYFALNKAINDNILITDEAAACEYAGIHVAVTLSNYENIKITTPEDMSLVNIFKDKFIFA